MIVQYYGDESSHNVVQELAEAGVVTSVQTDQGREQLGDFREYGAFLVRHGLSEEHALQALTLNGAKAMMLDDRIGSIAVGKDADLVLLDGHPFDMTGDRIERVLVDGVVEYERPSRPVRSMTAVGPFSPLSTMRGAVPAGPSFSFVNAHLFTVTKGAAKNATLVVEDGKIIAVGAEATPLEEHPTFDLGGRVVLPGFVSALAYPNDWIGDLKWQLQNDEITDRVTPEMNARFAVDPWFPSFDVIRDIGITTQNVTPGHRNLVGGSGVVIKNAGMDLDAMVRKEPSALVFSVEEDRGEIRAAISMPSSKRSGPLYGVRCPQSFTPARKPRSERRYGSRTSSDCVSSSAGPSKPTVLRPSLRAPAWASSLATPRRGSKPSAAAERATTSRLPLSSRRRVLPSLSTGRAARGAGCRRGGSAASRRSTRLGRFATASPRRKR